MSGPGKPAIFSSDRYFKELWLEGKGQVYKPVHVWVHETPTAWHGWHWNGRDTQPETTWDKGLWQVCPKPAHAP